MLHGLFSSYSESGLGSSVVVMCRLLIVVAFCVVEHRLQGAQASAVVACELSSCSSQALEHRLNSCGMGLVVLQQVGTSWTREQSCFPHG